MKVLRLILPAAVAATLCACGGSGIGSPGSLLGGQTPECATGTQVELVSPLPGQPTSNVSQLTIVANGNSNTLYSNHQNWYLYVTNAYGSQIQGAQLNLVSDPNGPHPYGSDFYYSSQLTQTLPSGSSWNAYLSENGAACSPVPLQGFSTSAPLG